jgi:hypothetical protein
MPFEAQKGRLHTAVPMPYLGVRRGWVANATLQQIYPREAEPVHILQEVEWKSGQLEIGQEISPPPGFEPRTLQPVASRNSTYAILAA